MFTDTNTTQGSLYNHGPTHIIPKRVSGNSRGPQLLDFRSQAFTQECALQTFEVPYSEDPL